MKKILFLLVALACSMNMSAQFMKIMKDGKFVAVYKTSQADRVEIEEAPAVSGPQLGVYSYTDDDDTYIITLSVNPDDPTDYIITNPAGLPDDSKWHATYDAEAKTLTCNGLEVGHEEQYGNQFKYGSLYGWYSKAKLWAYGYASFMESTNEDGDAPVVYNLNEEGYITGIKNYIFGGYVYLCDEEANIQQGLGWAYLMTNETVINYVGEEGANTRRQLKASKPALSIRGQKAQLSSKVLNTAKVAVPSDFESFRGLQDQPLQLKK